MIDTRTAPYAALTLRVVLGLLFLAHAGLKIFVFTPAGTAGFLNLSVFPAGWLTLPSCGNWQVPSLSSSASGRAWLPSQ